MDGERYNREFEKPEFLQYLKDRNGDQFDRNNKEFQDQNFSDTQLDRVSKIIKHISSPNQFSRDHLYTVEDFRKDIEGIDNALYCLVGSAAENNINSILSALLQNPSDENLNIFFYIVDTHPQIEFHKAIDIRHTAFDAQSHRSAAIIESVKEYIGEKVSDANIKENAHKMLQYIDQYTSIDDKNKLGLVNLAMLLDDIALFENLVNNPDIYLNLKGARNGNVLEAAFLNKSRGDALSILLINEGFNEKEMGALNEKILIQMLGVLDPASMSTIIPLMAQNFPSFAIAALNAVAFDFTAIGAVPEVMGDKDKALLDVTNNYKLILQCCKSVQFDFAYFITERNIAALAQNISNLPIALQDYGVSEGSTKKAIISVMQLMFLYQPQLIDALPIGKGRLSADQRDAMFFSMLMNEDNMEFLDGICNAYTAQYIEEFLQKSPEECKKILRNAGISNNAQLSELCVKMFVVSGVEISKEVYSLDFEAKRGWFERAPKVEKPASLESLIQRESDVEFFIGGIAEAVHTPKEMPRQSTKFVDMIANSQDKPRSRT